MIHKDIIAKLEQIRPEAQWMLHGDINNQADLDTNLNWLDTIQAKPTLAELGV